MTALASSWRLCKHQFQVAEQMLMQLTDLPNAVRDLREEGGGVFVFFETEAKHAVLPTALERLRRVSAEVTHGDSAGENVKEGLVCLVLRKFTQLVLPKHRSTTEIDKAKPVHPLSGGRSRA